MSRKVGRVEFAQLWAVVSRLPQKDWDALVELRNRLDASRPAKAHKARKPKPSEDPAMAETEAVVKRMRLRKSDGSLAAEPEAGGEKT